MTDSEPENFDPYAAYRPSDPDDLAAAVAHALSMSYGSSIEPDAEGGFRIQIGSSGMVVTPRPEGVLSIVSFVVTGMTTPVAAQPMIDSLNDQATFVRFQILGDAVVASCDVPAIPFVPQHLYTLINTVGEVLDFAGPQITECAGGQTLMDVLRTPERPALPAPFTADVRAALKQYVYMLIDPRDNAAFYIGKGTGDRVYHHVWTALGDAHSTGEGHELLTDSEHGDNHAVRTAKDERIRQIAAAGLTVEHHIVRVCDSPEEAFAVEQALISGFRIGAIQSEYGELTNIASGHYRFAIDDTRAEEIARRLGAEPAPELPRPSLVLKVNVAGATDDPDTIYDAARRAWSVGADLRSTPDLPVFVVAHDVVRAVYRAQDWTALDRAEGKSGVVWEFDGVLDPELNTKFAGKRLLPADFGQSTWNQRGCHPLR
ncbi:T3SS (YopN, CesT) and YbjN peptide-binding chaperone 1 [Dietzia cinnamea]|uniref:T3SS (YopN, CesT) and YbjN peptide-binding chaperone 1 n=1 Tax=Dietzia cinnamea TaxID=321318 RepID=UPI003F65FA4F